MWSPWKCEMITVSIAFAVDAGGVQIGQELAGRALRASKRRLADAGVDQHELAAGVDHDRIVRCRHEESFGIVGAPRARS